MQPDCKCGHNGNYHEGSSSACTKCDCKAFEWEGRMMTKTREEMEKLAAEFIAAKNDYSIDFQEDGDKTT